MDVLTYALTQPQVQQSLPSPDLQAFLREFSPHHIAQVKFYFAELKQSVNLTQFISLIILTMGEGKQARVSDLQLISQAVQIFKLIDIKRSGKIRFNQFTTFLIESEQILNRDQSLQEIKIVRSESSIIISAERVFLSDQYIILLDHTHRFILVYDSITHKELQKVSIGNNIIINVLAIPKTKLLLVASNDKHLNVFDFAENVIVSRFILPDSQSFLVYSNLYKNCYSCSSRGMIFQWQTQKLAKNKVDSTKTPKLQVFKRKEEKLQSKKEKRISSGVQPKSKDERSVYPNEDKLVSCMICIDQLQLIVTGSSDHFLRLYPNKPNQSSSPKILKGHKKPIKDIAFSAQKKHLISCSFQFEVLVWNTYLEHPVVRLHGHQAPLLTVMCPNNYAVICSLDSKGVMKIWSSQTHKLLQTNTHADEGRIKSIIFRQQDQKFYLAGKTIISYKFELMHNPDLSDDFQIGALAFSQLNDQIYVAADRHLKIWSLSKGVIKQVYKNVSQSQIVAVSLDKYDRRIFIASHNGSINILDVKTGFNVGSMSEHGAQVSFLVYSKAFSLLISASWDLSIKVHNDSNHIQLPDKRKNILRSVKNCHYSEIIMAAFSEVSFLIVTCSRTPVLRLWDFEKGSLQNQLVCSAELNCAIFLDPYPLLLCTDVKGFVFIWGIPPHQHAYKLLVSWKNMFTIQRATAVTCVKFIQIQSKVLLLVGDQSGYIRTLNLTEVFQRIKAKKLGKDALSYNKNPYRIQDKVIQNISKIEAQASKPLFQLEKLVRQVSLFKAHNKRVDFIHPLQKQKDWIILSCGSDILVKAWSKQGRCLGVLRQGGRGEWNLSIEVNREKQLQLRQYQSQVKKQILKLKKSKRLSLLVEKQETKSDIDNQEVFENLRDLQNLLSREQKGDRAKKNK